jgi:Leucine-rich repeat (LRR) protein
LLFAATYADVSPLEKEALVELYHATFGEKWTRSWDLSKPVDSWYGVSIEDDKVVAIDLSFNNLKGELPDGLNTLTHLKRLNLAFNAIGGKLPASLTDMVHLEELQLFSNKIKGTLPEDISNLQRLRGYWSCTITILPVPSLHLSVSYLNWKY